MYTQAPEASTTHVAPCVQSPPEVTPSPSSAGLLFRSETVATGWIRVGGILFTLIGCQYLGTAGADRQVGPGERAGDMNERVRSGYRGADWRGTVCL